MVTAERERLWLTSEERDEAEQVREALEVQRTLDTVQARHQAGAAGVAQYYDDPVGFARDCINWRGGDGLADYQETALDRLVKRRRVNRRGPHGLGKTTLEAITALWFALTRDATPDKGDWKVVSTASAWRQLTKYLWPEIHKWAYRIRWDVIGRGPFTSQELLTLSLKLRHGEAFAVASKNEALIEGAHADRILYLFDESKEIPAAVFDAAEGALSTGDAYALAVSTPGEPVGRFYDIQARKPGYEDWDADHITTEQAIAAGRMSAEWADARRRQWGEKSAAYQNRVGGNFASSEVDGVIPLAWVELANERWEAWHEAGANYEALDAIGTDVAAGGEDETAHALRVGECIAELRRQGHTIDTMAVAGVVLGMQQAYGGVAIVDGIGVGAGVVHRLREQKARVRSFIASERSEHRDLTGELGFANQRAEAWWNMREILDPANQHAIALPPDDELTGDLTAPHWRVLSGGNILIESKEDIRKRIGRSTNMGDAVVMAFALPAHKAQRSI